MRPRRSPTTTIALAAAALSLCGARPHRGPTANAPATSSVAPKPAASAAAPKTTTASAPPPAATTKIAPPAKKPAPKGKYASKTGIGWAPPAYVAMVKQWHLPTLTKPPLDETGRPKLVLYSINRGERVELVPSSDKGDFAPTEIDKATWILRSADGCEHPVDGALLNIVYELEKHFKAGEIRFVSGYRTPTKRLGSNHGYGRAMDLVIPGTIDEWVASYVRDLGYTGAGTYPISGFVHVDVRERSFYWIDKSGPGAPNKTKGILPGDAMANDAKAAKVGKVRPPSATIGRDVDGAIAARVKAVLGAATAAPTNDEDEGVDMDDDSEITIAPTKGK